MSHGIPHDIHIVDPRSGLLTRAWHRWVEMIGRHVTAASRVEAVSSPDATDLATVITLANELKDKIDALTLALGREE